MVVSTIILYLQPHVIKQVEDYNTCKALFEALQREYHHKELSNSLYTLLKLMSFKIKEGGTKIQDHIDAFKALMIE